ncbi:MAG TPA: PHP domain-containing protein, partial [Candidatus Hydrogenedentes bacterium]|nr:PHP domain-containing protein [Candidatus Hydrogenedentota bacterium]
MSAGFVHLHTHTEYSVLDGACKIHEILSRCKDYGMSACAITDHGAVFGAVDFFLAADKAGIKPVLGCELYVAKSSRFDRSARSPKESHSHLLLLCENEEGYHNLCRLSTIGFLEGYHYKPRVDDEVLAEYHAGLIAGSACLGGEIPQLVLDDNLDGANAAIEKYVGIFGKDNFVIELMDHGMPEERQINPVLVELADRHGLKVIATNDCHYLDKSDAEAHEVLLCVQTNSTLNDENRFRFPTHEFHFRSPDEMKELFAQWPEAIANTLEIAAR